MEPLTRGLRVQRASGLPDVAVLRAPARAVRVDRLVQTTRGNAALLALVRRAVEATGAEYGQLSLLAGTQWATSVSADTTTGATERTSALEDSLCTVTVLSEDVLPAADTRQHPWLHDLPPVVDGAVGAYLGVPLRLADSVTVGALCVFGARPRAWTGHQVRQVCQVADDVEAVLALLDQAA